jgi:hypothetical protein
VAVSAGSEPGRLAIDVEGEHVPDGTTVRLDGIEV